MLELSQALTASAKAPVFRGEERSMQIRQILFTGPAAAELTQKNLPALEPDQVLVEMEYTAVSAGTERDNLLGRPNTASRFPVALGYSGAGKVSALGACCTCRFLRFFR
jgi:threonine dehydrogenase-like Zn-dependent dehydrogenase